MQKNQSKYKRLCRQYLKYCCLFLTVIYHNQGFCQEIQNLRLIGGASNEELSVLGTKDCIIDIGGIYGEGMEFAGQNLQNLGKADIFCAYIDGKTDQLISFGGSSENDKLTALQRNSQNELFIAGLFFDEANFQDSLLVSGENISAAFISKYVGTDLVWSTILNGDSFEQVSDMVIDEDDNLYVTGIYNSRLTVDGTTINTEADEAIFLFKMNGEGELIWIRSYGLQGDSRVEKISYCQTTKQLILAGDFQGVLDIGDNTIQSNTADEDLFIASLNVDGSAEWLIKAGGVFIDDLNDMVVSEEGDIYLTGNFTGIINIDGQLQIETMSPLDANLFIIKLDKLGVPVWARSLGKEEFSDTGLAICLSEGNELYLSGYTTGSMTIDAINFVPEDDADFHIFIASFNIVSGEIIWLIAPEEATGLIVPNLIELSTCGDLIFGGAIRGTIGVQGVTYESEAFDGFLATVNLETNATLSPWVINSTKLYPNPSSGCFQLTIDEPARFSLYDLKGNFIFEQSIDGGEEICTNGLTGLFFWQVETEAGNRSSGNVVLEE